MAAAQTGISAHPSTGAVAVFLVSLSMLGLSLCLAITYFLTTNNYVGFLAAGLLLTGLIGLYGSLERAEHELQSPPLGSPSPQSGR